MGREPSRNAEADVAIEHTPADAQVDVTHSVPDFENLI
jgi:hypothetical protein